MGISESTGEHVCTGVEAEERRQPRRRPASGETSLPAEIVIDDEFSWTGTGLRRLSNNDRHGGGGGKLRRVNLE